MSSPPGTEMVQFPGYRRTTLVYSRSADCSRSRVTPFGHPRIAGYVLLPVAFRSLSRPSSPCGSEASTISPYSLDHISLHSTSTTTRLAPRDPSFLGPSKLQALHASRTLGGAYRVSLPLEQTRSAFFFKKTFLLLSPSLLYQ